MTNIFSNKSVFHAGERALQDHTGVKNALAPFAKKVIRDHIIEQHSEFYAQLPMLNIGVLDDSGQPWATAIFQKPGFANTIDEKTFSMAGKVLMAEQLSLKVTAPNKIGILGLQPHTRRRNRLNGVITSNTPDSIVVAVDQSFGNCPQFIQKRALDWRDPGAINPSSQKFDGVSKSTIAELEIADTFFIASRSKKIDDDPRNGIDVSHRGGRPGFVRVRDNILSFPDFRGNNYFNTLGNIKTDNRVGLFFPNFDTGRAIFLAGEARVVWNDARVQSYAGAERIVDIKVNSSVIVDNALPLRGRYIEAWPKLERTDIWTDAHVREYVTK